VEIKMNKETLMVNPQGNRGHVFRTMVAEAVTLQAAAVMEKEGVTVTEEVANKKTRKERRSRMTLEKGADVE